jgi:carbon storage regulator (csrA)
MLVLTRKVDEGIAIGDNIRIRVLAIEGNKVRLGITAAKNISIVREEIVEAVMQENLEAGTVSSITLDWDCLPYQLAENRRR